MVHLHYAIRQEAYCGVTSGGVEGDKS
jgi:hypothetical protein